MSTHTERLEAEVGKTLANPHVIVSAYDHVGPDLRVGFNLAACCAMVENESGGEMVWGHDPWDEEAYPAGIALDPSMNGEPVTQANYEGYKYRRNRGRQPQGCGITQLTSSSLQVEAEAEGGCWVPFYNALVGFRFLHSLFAEHGSALAGFTAYNGSGPAAEAYGQRAVDLQAAWQHRFNVALA